MSNTEQEHQQDIQRRREESARRRQEAERVVAEILVSISESGKEARQWFADLEEGARGRVIEALTASDPALSQSSDEAIGYVEGLKDKLPQENGQQVKVSLMNEDGNTVEVDIVRQDGKYYRIVEGEDEEVTIDGDTLVKRSKFNFEEELAKRFEQYKNENNIEGAISRKDFGLINRIIKNGANITATQLIAMMRLSTSELHGSRRTTPTFLHKLLDTKTGIADSDRVKPLLMTAKHILGTFEFNALCGLSDGTKPASTLFVRTLRDMLPAASVLKNAAIDPQSTHMQSVHASVDISLVKLYQEFQLKHPDIVPASTSTERGLITINRTDEFKGFVNLLASQLKDEINVYLNDKSKIEAISGIDSKNGDAEKEKKIKRKTLELAAAKRLMDDACSTAGSMHGGSYQVRFNELATNGVTLKEALAIVYSSIKSAENLEPGATEADGFARLVTNLFETRREYNVDRYNADPDKNKCSGGSMNHFVDSLTGICKGVYVACVTNDDIKKEVSEIVNKQLIGDLEEKQGDDKERFRIALAKYALGTDLSAVIEGPTFLQLKQDVKAEIKLRHEDHFKDDGYIREAEEAVSTVKADKGVLQELGEIKYSKIWQPAELLKAMESGILPLYTRTDQGYRLTSDIIKEKETDYYVQVENLIFESKSFDLLIKYQMNTEGMLGRVLAKLEAEEPAVGKLVDSLENIRSYFPDAVRDKGFIRLLIKAAPDPLRRRTVLHWAVIRSYMEIVGALIEEMEPDALAIPDKDGMTALHEMADEDIELAEKLIEKMNPDALAIHDKSGRTALCLAIRRSEIQIAGLLIPRMHQKDLDIPDKNGNTALHTAASKGHSDIIYQLLEAGADVMRKNLDGKTAFAITDKYGQTALHVSIKNRDTKLARLLIARMDPKDLVPALDLAINGLNGPNNDVAKALIERMDRTALLPALEMAINGLNGPNNDVAKALIERMDRTALLPALEMAIKGSRIDIAKALIETMDQKDLAPALEMAIKGSRIDIAKALIERMDPKDLVPALEMAIKWFRDDIATALIERMDPTALLPALEMAIKCFRDDIAKALIEKMDPKDLAIKNVDGMSALNLARTQGFHEIEVLILAKINALPPLHQAVLDNDLQKVQELVLSTDINAVSNAGNAAIHIAASKGRGEIVRELLRAGADAMIRNPDGKTAFDVANGEAKIILETDRFLKENIAVEPHKVMQKIIERSVPISFADKLRGNRLNPLDQKMIQDYLNTKIGGERMKQVTRFSQILKNGTKEQQEIAMKYGADPSLVSDFAKNYKNSSVRDGR